MRRGGGWVEGGGVLWYWGTGCGCIAGCQEGGGYRVQGTLVVGHWAWLYCWPPRRRRWVCGGAGGWRGAGYTGTGALGVAALLAAKEEEVSAGYGVLWWSDDCIVKYVQ